MKLYGAHQGDVEQAVDVQKSKKSGEAEEYDVWSILEVSEFDHHLETHRSHGYDQQDKIDPVPSNGEVLFEAIGHYFQHRLSAVEGNENNIHEA